jgi:thioredoxin reductase (NADPH)
MARKTDAPADCLIIGGGPAGLVAAQYLSRFRRNVVLIDAGESRAGLIPRTRNLAGFPDGVNGKVLLARLRLHARKYGARLVRANAETARKADGLFEVDAGGKTCKARTLLIAAGVRNIEPAIDRHADAVARGAVRYCPICDGHEVIGKRVAVIGNSPRSVHEIAFLKTYSDKLSLIAADAPAQEALASHGGAPLGVAERIMLIGNKVEITLVGAAPQRFDSLYSCLGVRPRVELARALGVTLSEAEGVVTDSHQHTNVEGVFAAGDVVEALDQISVAIGHAAIAATTIHNFLREKDAAV